ncbi:hypothetical protein [uncultured Ruthenibacterium sp.]|uniref:hypothetical protein n=1 Tax=uncultured Ruthenibacterium sp. TaxID=1905347 RepID=UPI00349E7EC6
MKKQIIFKKWHKLDNTANLFPVVASRRTTNVFRLTAILRDPVDPAILQRALEQTLPYFAAFGVRLRHGLFWSYLEANEATPVVRLEQDVPCRYLDPLETGRYLFRVLYFENRVHLETFHVLTDGTGAMRFLKAICYRYCQLAYPNETEQKRLYGLEQAGNVEDCYLKYSRPIEKGTYKEPNAFHIKGTNRLAGDVGVNTLLIPVKEIKALCQKENVSVGEYLAALVLWSIRQAYVPASGSKKPVNLFVPVNLRRIFNDDTSLNFFSGITVSNQFEGGTSDFTRILEQTKKQFAEKCTRDVFERKLAYTAQSERNLFTRIIPLPIKNGVLRLIYEHSSHGSTTTLSNLGMVTVEQEFQRYFCGFRFLLPPSPGEPLKCTACTFDQVLALNVTTLLEGNALVKQMIQHLTQRGIPLVLESNGDSDETL